MAEDQWEKMAPFVRVSAGKKTPQEIADLAGVRISTLRLYCMQRGIALAMPKPPKVIKEKIKSPPKKKKAVKVIDIESMWIVRNQA